MRRKLDSSLDVWVRSSHRKPLVLFGARGVGKTTAIRDLAGRANRQLARVDFSADPQAREVFQTTRDPREITRALGALKYRQINSSQTLLLLDEIQRCDEALTSLGRFKSDMPDLPVAATGSSLGVRLARGSHTPLSLDCVTTETLHPLDFEEFCWAVGEGPAFDIAAECAERMQPCPIHAKMMSLYREYLLVGGMPQAVERYRESRNVDTARAEQQSIRLLYTATMAEDAGGVDASKIAATWKSLPSQLAKATGSTKFMWKYIARGAKAERYASALDWLEQAGFVNLCTQVSGAGGKTGKPAHASAVAGLSVFENPSSFKAYVADTGLLARAYDATLSDVADGGAGDFRMPLFGAGLAENFVMQELVASGVRPHYWGMRSKHEAQFVVETSDGVVPMNVAGVQPNARATAARDFAARYGSPFAVQVANRNIESRERDGLEVRVVPPYVVSRVVA